MSIAKAMVKRKATKYESTNNYFSAENKTFSQFSGKGFGLRKGYLKSIDQVP